MTFRRIVELIPDVLRDLASRFRRPDRLKAADVARDLRRNLFDRQKQVHHSGGRCGALLHRQIFAVERLRDRKAAIFLRRRDSGSAFASEPAQDDGDRTVFRKLGQ